MEPTSRTLYIPLRGKAVVSRKNVLLCDKKAEEIWQKESFPLHGKAASKWLAYFMGMRAAVIDDWLRAQLAGNPSATVLHIGCGLDARCERVSVREGKWVDVDLPEVIDIRRRYYAETSAYTMLGADASKPGWIASIGGISEAVVVMEGLSMYLPAQTIQALFAALQERFAHATLIMDAYTSFAVRASRYSNPIRSVGAGVITGVDDPTLLETSGGVRFLQRLSLTPEEKIRELHGFDRAFFRFMFAGKTTDRIYRLYTYDITQTGQAEQLTVQ